MARAIIICHRGGAVYTRQVRFQWKFMLMLVAVALIGAGCGGINASQSVSPATFLMPGILKNTPPCSTNAPIAVILPAENSIAIASVR
jgi:hypothetical protein